MFKKILIANRGEIACRIIYSARKMGIATVAVYSEPDSSALHVELADEAYCIGPAAATLSYLNQQEILRVAKAAGAEAIHPGYGFLSENPEFALACKAAGLIFVGPSPDVITSMGIKSRARDIMEQAGIPVIPGCYIDEVPDSELEGKGEGLGYPLLIKADRGGGGKGIRLVNATEEMNEAIAAARREAAGAFGDASLLMEKQIVNARHVEVQIFRDIHGNAVHLFERDCSLQRRHQKILEESPAPGISERIRQKLHRTAVAAAETLGYVGAGTVEFLVEPDGEFYFLEINTRLQVEHPVTEMITGQDLVAWQLLVAAGEPLPLGQEELECKGHAIEVRVYAEDPVRNFLPSTGTIHYLRQPMTADGVRVDSGVRQGDMVTPFYDPMLAKLIVWGEDRHEAILRLLAALAEYHFAGITVNIGFLRRLAVDPAFSAATHTTRYVDEHLDELTRPEPITDETLAIVALYRVLENQRMLYQQVGSGGDPYSPWNSGKGFRVNESDRIEMQLLSQGEMVTVHMYPVGDGYRLEMAGVVMTVTVVELHGAKLRCRLQGKNVAATLVTHDEQITVFCAGNTFHLLLPDLGRVGSDGGGGNSLRAPIPGKVTELFVEAGDTVRQGDQLLVLEAMKMEYAIRAPADGTVISILYRQGDSVQEKDRLVEFQPLEEKNDAAA
ncbi:acetyl/propionyl/methylcrotonyl-CoA carboxylase subunit alpha [Desulfopila aestuarii]|uniref:3-methylcrotonyl-CoA carboxylase alpha subunit n=1 Tax=Desulfopila aestuarii DSM 18488 TaxID=1121416 RepID=A0A1M7Y5Z7_9BACT|nr:biotin carboxylase N-terminal domain-containing protein [Desulfopila aestuarii]SHO47819.1 3-methylcrotonyl-CoA carboxylase alpha subunit [Desulfopila aestuarii DSM 18488]